MGPRAGSLQWSPLRPVGLGLVLAGSLLAATALADTTVVRDKRNTRANLLDISSASAGHNGSLLQHTIRTYRTWRSKELETTRQEPRDLCVYIWRAKSDPEEQQDYQVCAHYEDGELKGSVFHVRPPRRKTGKLRVRRLDLRSITYTFEKRAIGNPRAYQWQAIAGYTGKRCPRDPPFQFGCDDSAPTGDVRTHTLTTETRPGPRHER
jgi:hypothetical protein